MKKAFLFLTLGTCVLSLNAQKKTVTTTKAPAAAATQPKLVFKNLKDSTSYGIGVNIGRNLKAQGLSDIDALLLYKGLSDVLLNKPTAIPDEVVGKCISQYSQKANGSKAAGPKADGQKFLAANAKKPGIKSMPGGWQYEVLKPSDDTTHPKLTDKVKVHYHGTLIDGTVFDSSVDRGEPISFPLNGVIKGWQEAVQKMTIGAKWKIYLPSDLAYGDNAAGEKIPGGSTLIFEVELLGIEK